MAAWSLVALAVAALGAAAILGVLRLRAVESWDRYDAQVISAEIESRPASNRHPPEDGYGVRATIAFVTDGKAERRVVEPRVFTTSFSEAAREADSLRGAGAHRLFVNPHDRDDAVLDPGPSLRMLIVPAVIAIFGGGLLAFGLLMLVIASGWAPSWRLFPRVAFVVCAMLVAFAFVLIAKATRQRTWPTIDAEVTRADQVYREEEASDGDNKRYEDFYALRTWLAFDVNGTRYSGVIVDPYQRNANLRNSVAARSKVGHLRVRYNPSDPYEVIETPVSVAFAAIPLGLALLFGGLGILVSRILRRRADSSSQIGVAA